MNTAACVEAYLCLSVNRKRPKAIHSMLVVVVLLVVVVMVVLVLVCSAGSSLGVASESVELGSIVI